MAMHDASTRAVGFYRHLLPLLILAAALFLPGTTYAQSIDPTTLTYRLQTGDSLTLYFTLTTPRPLAEVTFGNNGLVNDDHTANIPPDKIIVAPENQATLEGQQRFAVTIQQPGKPGHFAGDLAIHYKGQPPNQALAVTLDVTVLPKPKVAASAASPNQILKVLPNFFYLGDCSVAPAAMPAGGQIVITLEQSGLGKAALLDVKLDPLRATAQSLPASVLSVSPAVSPTQPLATTAGTADLTVYPPRRRVSRPASTPAGCARWSQARTIRSLCPSRCNPKSACSGRCWLLSWAFWLVPSAITLTRRSTPLAKAIQKTEGIRRTLTEPTWLLAEEIEKFAGSLKEIQDSMMGGEEPSKVDAALDGLSTQIKTAQETNQKFVTDEVGQVRTALDKLTVGEKVAGMVRNTLTEIENRVKAGSYANLTLARKDLAVTEEQKQELQKIADIFGRVKNKADEEAAQGKTPQVDIGEAEG